MGEGHGGGNMSMLIHMAIAEQALEAIGHLSNASGVVDAALGLAGAVGGIALGAMRRLPAAHHGPRRGNPVLLGRLRARHRGAREGDALVSRSGKPTLTNDKRSRPMVTITLSPEALARLDAIAEERGQSRSGAVEQLVRNARLAKD